MSDDTRRVGAVQRPRTLGAGEQIGDWRVDRVIASGGFATVYEAHHRTSDRPAALKLLHAHLVASPLVVARFEREVRVVARLRHPNIVELVDAGFHGGRPYLCMELLAGGDLYQLIGDRVRLTADETLAVLAPLVDALATAHDQGIIHRDVKARNVIAITNADGAIGRVVLLDFGIAKLADALAPELTATNQSLGTPSSMAPEQHRGEPVDARTDVYALGALLFHMLTGRLAFEVASATMTQYLHLHARRPKPSAITPVPVQVDEVIARAMAIEPRDRYPDVRAMLAATRVALAGARAAELRCDATAVLVTVRDAAGGAALDGDVLRDLEAAIPIVERVLVPRGFVVALELGTSALYVSTPDALDALSAAYAAWAALEQRDTRHARVQVAMVVHRGPATFAGSELRPCTLVDVGSWPPCDAVEGLWATSAIATAAAPVTRIA